MIFNPSDGIWCWSQARVFQQHRRGAQTNRKNGGAVRFGADRRAYGAFAGAAGRLDVLAHRGCHLLRAQRAPCERATQNQPHREGPRKTACAEQCRFSDLRPLLAEVPAESKAVRPVKDGRAVATFENAKPAAQRGVRRAGGCR